MQLTKHIGCLLALVFATASAFADDVVQPTWFSATIGTTLGEGWSGSTGSDYWSFADNVGKLNNMSATGDNKYLTFTATPKNLPGDESTIKTSVKFTAMDKADFDALEFPTGAKGGLTIVEDSDAATPTPQFYGIVGGKWEPLVGDTTAALAGQVDVEVKIWENNGKHISYKVGNQDLKLTNEGSADLATSFDGTTISSVSYKGVCEIASLQGDAQDELWTLTLKTIADAQSVLYRVGEGNWTAVPQDNKIKATAENVQIKYTAPTGKYFFPEVGGPGTGYVESAAKKITGSGEYADFSKDLAFANVDGAIDAVAEVVNGSKYASIGAAVGAGNAVNVLKSATETVTIGKAVTLTAENDVDISGKFTWSAGGELTIESGAYDCEFAGFTPETLIFKGGLYTQIAKDVQPFCDDKYFALANDGTYKTLVELGQDVEPTQDVPSMTVDSEVVTKAGGKGVAVYLAEETAGEGSMKRWQSYALGLGTEPTKEPEFAATNDNDVANINLVKNFEVLKSAGVAVTYQVGEATASAEEPKIAINDLGYTVTKKVVKVFTGDVLAGQTTIGANKVKAPTDANTRSLVTVPWADSATGTGVTIANLFKTAALKGGEKIELYDQASDTYTEWTFTEGAWSDTTESLANAEAKDPATTVVKKGQALWFTGAADAVQFGVDSTAESTTPVIAGKWGFAANPISGTAKELSAIVAPTAAPKAQVQLTDDTGATTVYFVKDGAWGYSTIDAATRRRVFTSKNPSIAAGQAFWFDNTKDDKQSANLAW